MQFIPRCNLHMCKDNYVVLLYMHYYLIIRFKNGNTFITHFKA